MSRTVPGTAGPPAAPEIAGEAVVSQQPVFDQRPPGERYFRHPGDVVRLVVWGAATIVLVLLIELAEGTDDGIRQDLGEAVALIPLAVRELTLAAAQIAALLVPVVIAICLIAQRRWRRTVVLLAAAVVGAGLFVLLDRAIGLPGRAPGALGDEDAWLISARFPSTAYLAAAASATIVGKPWLGRGWRRSADRAVWLLLLTMLIAGTSGLAELLLAITTGSVAGAALLVVVGAPNRRPSPQAIADGLRRCDLGVTALTLERAVGGRSQLYRATLADGTTTFVKVYARDSRDADLLYRGYRNAVLRDPGDDLLSAPLARAVEHQGLALLLARRGGVRCPDLRALTSLPDGSMVLALEDMRGRPLDTLTPEELTTELLDGVWGETRRLHAAGLAHRALRAGNILVTNGGPVIVDLGRAEAPADPRLKAIDRAELLVSLAEIVGADRATATAAAVLTPEELATAAPYLQPLALSAATRKSASKSLLKELRDEVAAATGHEPEPLERLVRVRARTLLMIATLTGAFYFLLPQLANVDDSFRALRSANWGWLAGAVVMSGVTYVGAAVGLVGGVSERLPFGATVEAQLASSFVNRVTPANVGGMALNVRFMQKAGVPPAEAVTGMGLNVFAGAVVHVVLLVLFFAWAGQGGVGFSIPSSSKLLVVIVVLLAVLGIVIATRKGRRLVRKHVLGGVKRSLESIGSLARSPRRLLALFGGSLIVTLAYVVALACATNAFDAGVGIAQVGAVYLGSSILAAAAPTPGGLGAMEAALVAGFTAIGMEPAIAVAAVLSYRLATFWLPILPGWIAFHFLERRSYI
jgi:glycosyltransferase 2 family protein